VVKRNVITQIGSQLVGVLYILMNQVLVYTKETTKLIHSLEQLRDIGNSVIVVEHDKDMIVPDYVIDMAKPGKYGGNHQ
jgi:excinuclease ABC subunit A